MKVVFFSMPFYGHIMPNMQLFEELSKQSIKTLVFSDAVLSKFIIREYVSVIYYPNEVMNFLKPENELFEISENPADKYYSYLMDPLLIKLRKDEENRLEEIFCQKYIEDIRAFNPDVIIGDTQAVFTRKLIQHLEKAVIYINSSAYMPDIQKSRDFRNYYEHIIRKETSHSVQYERLLAIHRKQKRMENEDILPGKQVGGEYHYAYISPCLQREQKYVEGRIHFLGADILKIKPMEKDDYLYITRGTIYDNYNMGILVGILNCIEGTGISAHVSLGNNVFLRKKINSLHFSSRIVFLDFADQIKELLRSKIFITHGGITGVKEAIFCGTPMIVIPTNFSDYQVGKAISDAGIGMLLEDWPLKAESIKNAVDFILQNYECFYNAVMSCRDELKQYWNNNGVKSLVDQCMELSDKKRMVTECNGVRA